MLAFIKHDVHIAAVSCSTVGYRLGGVKFGSGTTGKLGRAWVCAWLVHGWCMGDVVCGWDNCMYTHIESHAIVP